MRLLFDSTCNKFLDLYDPNITFLDEAKICEDSYSVKYFLEETGLTLEEVREELKFNANKNHISIPCGTKAKVLSIKGGGEETILQIKNIRFSCYLTKNADTCYVDATPLNPEFEKVFSNKKVNKKDDTTLYGIKLYDLVEAVNDIYGINNMVFAYEELKLITEKEAIRTYNQWFVKNKLYGKDLE